MKHQAIMVEDPGRESLCRSLMIMAHRFLLILNRKAMVELQQDAKLVSWTAVKTIILQMKNVLIGCLVWKISSFWNILYLKIRQKIAALLKTIWNWKSHWLPYQIWKKPKHSKILMWFHLWLSPIQKTVWVWKAQIKGILSKNYSRSE